MSLSDSLRTSIPRDGGSYLLHPADTRTFLTLLTHCIRLRMQIISMEFHHDSINQIICRDLPPRTHQPDTIGEPNIAIRLSDVAARPFSAIAESDSES